MSLACRATAFLMMFAWCFATVHLWVDHGGGEAGHHIVKVSPTHHHHAEHDYYHHHHSRHAGDEQNGGEPSGGGEPDSPDAHHHHDLGVTARDSGKSLLKAPLVAILFVTLLVTGEADANEPASPAIAGAPPDQRSSGYLFVLQTARPVRGPSVVA